MIGLTQLLAEPHHCATGTIICKTTINNRLTRFSLVRTNGNKGIYPSGPPHVINKPTLI